MDVLVAEELTTRIIAQLDGAVTFPVGDHTAPTDTSERYAIVYTTPGGHLVASTLSGLVDDADLPVQVDSYGGSRQQAQWTADAVRTALLGRAHPGGGYAVDLNTSTVKVIDRRVGSPGAPTYEGVDTAHKDGLYVVREEFVFCAAPA